MEISTCFLARFFFIILLDILGSRNRVVPSSWNKRHKKHARNIAHDKAELQDAGKKALTKACHTQAPLASNAFHTTRQKVHRMEQCTERMTRQRAVARVWVRNVAIVASAKKAKRHREREEKL